MLVQEVIASVRPDSIIEPGIAHGGSLVFYATLCRALGQGRVVGVDVVLAELQVYAHLVGRGSYFFVMDGIMSGSRARPGRDRTGTGTSQPGAIVEFLREDAGFVLKEPAFAFN